MSDLIGALAQRILVLDGAMGTMIQNHDPDEADYRGERFADWESDLKGNNDLLTLTKPELIRDITAQYAAAGSDILTTNTFSATTIAQADYHMEDLAVELNLEAAKIARSVAEEYATPDKPRWVAGVIGPTNRTASISPDVNDPGKRNTDFNELAKAYGEAAEALLDGGVDIRSVRSWHRGAQILGGRVEDAKALAVAGRVPAAIDKEVFSVVHGEVLVGSDDDQDRRIPSRSAWQPFIRTCRARPLHGRPLPARCRSVRRGSRRRAPRRRSRPRGAG